MLKVCNRCKEILPMEQFIIDRDTFSANCPLCVIELSKEKNGGKDK